MIYREVFDQATRYARVYFGLTLPITDKEIFKKAFREAVKYLHPDNGETGDEKKFKEMYGAYEFLITHSTIPGVFTERKDDFNEKTFNASCRKAHYTKSPFTHVFWTMFDDVFSDDEVSELDDFVFETVFSGRITRDLAMIQSVILLLRRDPPSLEWHCVRDYGYEVYKADPNRERIQTQEDLEREIGGRLSGITIGTPEKDGPIRLMIKDGAGNKFFFDDRRSSTLHIDVKAIIALRQTWKEAREAFRKHHRDRIGNCDICDPGEKVFCANCDKETKYIHYIGEAHGIAGTYMSGSEHYRCRECGHCVFLNDKLSKPVQYRSLSFPHEDSARASRA